MTAMADIGNVCRYCFAPIPEFAEPNPILKRQWDPKKGTYGNWIEVDTRKRLEFCSEIHRRAFARKSDRQDDIIREAIMTGSTDAVAPPWEPEGEQQTLL